MRYAIAVAALAGAFAAAHGQSVLLQIKPRIGDTVHMRLDQQTEMASTRRVPNGETTTSATTTMIMFSRAIIEGKEARGMLVLAVTDSVLLSTTDELLRGQMPQAQERLRGQRARFRVAADGTVGMADEDAKRQREVSDVVALMPAAFPKGPVAVGESWIREMPLSAGTQLGAPLSGKLHVTFRLDSLGRGGDVAYVSMRGEMQPGSVLPGSAGVEKGSVTGSMMVDRRRGWLTDSRFSIFMTSLMTPPAVAGMSVLRMRVRITQHMQTVDRH
jgi:hypothetical protein